MGGLGWQMGETHFVGRDDVVALGEKRMHMFFPVLGPVLAFLSECIFFCFMEYRRFGWLEKGHDMTLTYIFL